jgi:hypothetical protein
MSYRSGALGLTALSMLALGFAVLPSRAVAQTGGPGSADTAANDQLNKPINLDVKSANLYYALTLLFDQLKIGNYTLPDQLKQIEVSAHFTQLPLRTALETLLKNGGYTYKVDGGVYSVVPRNVEAPPEALPPDTTPNEPLVKGKKIYRIAGNNIIYNAVDIVTRLGGRVLPGAVGSQIGASSTGVSGLGGGTGGGLGSGMGGGLGGFGGMGGGLGGFGGMSGGAGNFGGGMGGFSGGGGLVGGGGYFGGGNNFGGSRGGRGF